MSVGAFTGAGMTKMGKSKIKVKGKSKFNTDGYKLRPVVVTGIDKKAGKSSKPFRLLEHSISSVSLAPEQQIDWGLTLFGIPQLWKLSRGEGVNVAIIDSGIAETHGDLAGALKLARDFTNSPIGYYDRVGHGTHLAGIVAARDNDWGVVGIAPSCQLLAAKVVDDNGEADPTAVIDAIDWATGNGANVISLSFGRAEPDEDVHNAILRSIAAGCVVVCAAGNTGPFFNSVLYPAAYPEVICVGACNKQLLAYPKSARGREMDILAPGEDITSTYPAQIYATLSGTSMAAPFVAGVTALILSKHQSDPGDTPVLTQQDVLAHLIKSATDAGDEGFDQVFGYGLINPKSLLT